MTKTLLVNPNDETFAELMRKAAKAIRLGDEKLIEKIKKEFLEFDTTLFYNADHDEIRVVVKDCPYVDFPTSQFTDLEKK